MTTADKIESIEETIGILKEAVHVLQEQVEEVRIEMIEPEPEFVIPFNWLNKYVLDEPCVTCGKALMLVTGSTEYMCYCGNKECAGYGKKVEIDIRLCQI